MSWYKYWYYTIFFIYDSFGKDREQNKAFSVGCFSLIIYMVYSLLGAYTNMMFENPILKYIAHPCSHFIFIIMIYCLNGFLFWPEKKARIGRSIYREKNEKKKKEEVSVAASIANSAAQDERNSRQGAHYNTSHDSHDNKEDFTIHSAEEARRAIIWGEILQRKY